MRGMGTSLFHFAYDDPTRPGDLPLGFKFGLIVGGTYRLLPIPSDVQEKRRKCKMTEMTNDEDGMSIFFFLMPKINDNWDVCNQSCINFFLHLRH